MSALPGFRAAGTPEIIRSHQKDDFYLSFFRSSVADVVQRLAGPLSWMRWRRELDVLCDIGYFLLTTFGGYQTVGEEYVNMIMVDQTKRSLPSKISRGSMIGLQVCMPYILQLALDKLERRLQSAAPLPVDLTGPQRDKLLNLIPALRHAVTLIHRTHLSFFYIQGLFYHFAKRLTGIHYIRYMSKQDNSALSRPFRILGYLSLAQLAVSAGLQVYSTWKAATGSTDSSLDLSSSSSTSNLDESAALHPSLKCSLCLGPRRRTTLTVCGHLFCWDCIHQWCQQKAECPLCREPLPPHRLVALQNYDPV